jgi:hypothetical protein
MTGTFGPVSPDGPLHRVRSDANDLTAVRSQDATAFPSFPADGLARPVGQRRVVTALVTDAVDVPLSMERIEHGLLGGGDMGMWAEAAYRRGERLAVGPGGPALTASVELDVGEPVYGTDSVTIPFAWRAIGAAWFFPHMEAEIVLSPITPTLTHLSFRGRYRPPLQLVGAMLDKVAMHRIAEATVRSFLERLADALDGGDNGGAHATPESA